MMPLKIYMKVRRFRLIFYRPKVLIKEGSLNNSFHGNLLKKLMSQFFNNLILIFLDALSNNACISTNIPINLIVRLSICTLTYLYI